MVAEVTAQNGSICISCETSASPAAETCPSCGGSLLLADQYRVLRALGKGGASQTWEVVREPSGERFALKALNLRTLEEWKVLEHFDRQFELLTNLHHPGIADAEDDFDAEIGGVQYRCLVQELVDGGSLHDALQEGRRFTEGDALAFLERMLDVLEYLHGFSPPVIHRDIKPKNIVLRAPDEPVLIDFDTARGVAIDHSMADGTMVGTAGYVPPEQLSGRAVPASDIYGLGMTMLAILTRKDPTELPVERMKVQFQSFVNVSPHFRRVLGKMVEPAVEDRYQSAKQVLRALEEPAADVQPAAPRDTTRPGKLTREDVGEGKRITAAKLGSEWERDGRLVWPTTATASSSYGGGWSARSLTGPPRVFPNYGDKSGSWAPKSSNAGEAWIECRYDCDARVEEIWIFETFNPGAVFSVTVESDGSNETVYFRNHRRRSGQQSKVLRVSFSPRQIQKVVVKVDNTVGSSWNEIDTVALVACEPLQENVNWRAFKYRLGRTSTKVWLLVALFLAAIIGYALYSVTSGNPPEERQASSSTSTGNVTSDHSSSVDPTEAKAGGESTSESDSASDRGPYHKSNVVIPSAAEAISGTTVSYLPSPGALPAGVKWAGEVIDASSEYDYPKWSGEAALGPPNVYPKHGDNFSAWAPKLENRGVEYLELSFEPTSARSIIVVETFNSGAVVRVDDISKGGGEPPVTLWEGELESSKQARQMILELPEPRTVLALRVVLDTSRVAGWNELDSVGLVPAK